MAALSRKVWGTRAGECATRSVAWCPSGNARFTLRILESNATGIDMREFQRANPRKCKLKGNVRPGVPQRGTACRTYTNLTQRDRRLWWVPRDRGAKAGLATDCGCGSCGTGRTRCGKRSGGRWRARPRRTDKAEITLHCSNDSRSGGLRTPRWVSPLGHVRRKQKEHFGERLGEMSGADFLRLVTSFPDTPSTRILHARSGRATRSVVFEAAARQELGLPH